MLKYGNFEGIEIHQIWKWKQVSKVAWGGKNHPLYYPTLKWQIQSLINLQASGLYYPKGDDKSSESEEVDPEENWLKERF